MEILIDTHIHSVSSGHAYSTIDEIARFAKSKDLKIVAITDHATSMPGGAHQFYFGNIRVLPDYIHGVRILKGVETNIIDYEGNLDFGGEILEGLELVIASFHPPCIKSANKEIITKAVIKTIENPYVNIIGHPGDERYPMDFEKVVKHAKKHKVLLEVNNSSLKATSMRTGVRDNLSIILKYCMKYNNPVVLGSDAHFHEDVGGFKESIELLKEVNFPEELVINLNQERFMEFISKESWKVYSCVLQW